MCPFDGSCLKSLSIVHSMSGETAKDISKYRPHVPILAFAHTPKVESDLKGL